MIKSYKTNPYNLASRCLLVFGHVLIGNDEEYFLMDGQQ